MILYTMTKEELVKELTADTQWIDSLRGGIVTKYSKRLNPKTAPDGHSLLGITTYTTPRKNRVIVAWTRVKTGKYITLESMHYFQYTAKNGTIQYINPCYGNQRLEPKNIVIYTAHALQRVRERAGMNLLETLAYQCSNEATAHYVGKYMYKGELKTMFNLGDKGMFITTEHRWGTTALTFVSYDLLGEAQEEEIKKCIRKTREYNDRKLIKLEDDCAKLPRFLKRSVMI